MAHSEIPTTAWFSNYAQKVIEIDSESGIGWAFVVEKTEDL